MNRITVIVSGGHQGGGHGLCISHGEILHGDVHADPPAMCDPDPVHFLGKLADERAAAEANNG